MENSIDKTEVIANGVKITFTNGEAVMLDGIYLEKIYSMYKDGRKRTEEVAYNTKLRGFLPSDKIFIGTNKTIIIPIDKELILLKPIFMKEGSLVFKTEKKGIKHSIPYTDILGISVMLDSNRDGIGTIFTTNPDNNVTIGKRIFKIVRRYVRDIRIVEDRLKIEQSTYKIPEGGIREEEMAVIMNDKFRTERKG